MRKVKLKQLADVQMGYSFRSRLEVTEEGSVAVIQMKDLGEDALVHCEALARVDMPEVKRQHLTKVNDLIFRSRGLINTAALLRDDMGEALVAAPLLRIRVKEEATLAPEYLCWYLEQREAQAFLSSSATGTVHKMISKKMLEELELVLPDMPTQKAIVHVAYLARREREILLQLADKRQKLISTKLMQSLNE